MQNKTQKIVLAALLAALICITTTYLQVPMLFVGNINLGDCLVLLAGWLLSPVYGFLTAGIGSSLADIFSGYAIYAPATFVIKGLMAVIAHSVFVLMFRKTGKQKKLANTLARIISGALAEILMVLGYYIFEGFMYGFIPSLASIPFNTIQGTSGLILGIVLIKVFEKNKITL